jgi:hypothetical protein
MGFRLQQLLRADDRYRLSCWLFLRGLALIYFIAFLSLAVQITGLAGPSGILPFYETLSYTHVQHGWLAWLRFPTVFWLDASDVALKMAAYGGAILAALLFFERWQTGALIGMYVLYVSLFHAGDLFLTFQWDTLLLETGFLSIFLVKGGPSRLLLFMFHWLLFRFRFMSGFFKLYKDDPTWWDLTTLNYYFETQVLPHGGSWYFHQLPDWILSGGVLYVFFTELIVPFFIFLPRRFRIAAALITIFTQLLIMATSNHNFVNLLVIVLCIFLLDDRFISSFMPGRLIERVRAARNPLLSHTSSAVLGIVAILILVTSAGTFMMRTLPVNYPAVVVRSFAAIYNYGIGHIFHVYPVMQVERQELEIQGSNDGINWHPYGFRYKPGPVNKRPPVNIPHQPRLDWMMWFLPPQARGDDLWLNMLLRRLHEGSPQVLQLFEYNPFPDHPPRFLRVVAYDYRFTTPEEKAATGNWWHRSYLGVFPYVKPRRP